MSGFIGALVGGAFVIRSLRTGRIEVRAVELPRRVIALDSLQVSVEFNSKGDRIVAKTDHTVRMNSLEASVVQDWLDDNDLVVQFKGPDKDVKVPAKARRPWQDTQ
ncbi:hypothetical protein LJR290_007715 [Variovorax sp. LjRoot290]|uniref:hypothetical protein n=1 Tax=unclassified Variovorax TaxID=663243 RepID=UPI003ECEE67D